MSFKKLAFGRKMRNDRYGCCQFHLRCHLPYAENNETFYDLGSDFYNKFDREKKIRSYLNKLSELGYDLTAITVAS